MKIKSTHRWLATTVFAVTIALLGINSGHGNDPDALWKLVHDKCVPDQRQNDNPAPCAVVDLREGDATGYAILKDLVGATQYLLIPTARVPGIESPLLLTPEAPNYFADAWRERATSSGRPTARCRVRRSVSRSTPRSGALRTSYTYTSTAFASMYERSCSASLLRSATAGRRYPNLLSATTIGP